MNMDYTGRLRLWLLRAGIAATLLLTGCDEELRATVEDGIITASSSLLAAFLRALTDLGNELVNAAGN